MSRCNPHVKQNSVKETMDELKKLVLALKAFQDLDHEMQIPTMLSYIYPAMQNPSKPLTIKGVAQKTGVKQSSGSRNVMAFTEVTRHRTEGHNLLKTEENPMFRTEKLITLTDEGERFKEKLIEILEKN